jgi:Leucine-rich repeat (LRR) protein
MAKPLAKLLSMLTPKRRWAQFSLLTLLLVVAVLCVGLSLVVVPAERQRRAVAAIKALGGRVQYVTPDQDASKAFPRPFLRRWLPRDYFDAVQAVTFRATQITDAGLAHLRGLRGLQVLSLGSSQVTDAGLAHLRALTGLQELSFDGTQVTDAGVTHLQALTELTRLTLWEITAPEALGELQELPALKELRLAGDEVCDEDVAALHGDSRLVSLEIENGNLSDVGLAELATMSGLRKLHLNLLPREYLSRMPPDRRGWRTEAGWERLGGMEQLEELCLESDISDSELVELQGLKSLRRLSLSAEDLRFIDPEPWMSLRHLEDLDVGDTLIDDSGVAMLAGLRNLRELDLTCTGLTDEATEYLAAIPSLTRLRIYGFSFSSNAKSALRQALPKCIIEEI